MKTAGMSWFTRSFTAALTSLSLIGTSLTLVAKDVEVVGVQVQKEVPEFSSPYTGVTFILKQQGKWIVGADFDKSHIASFSDDKGTDLKNGQDQRRMLVISTNRFKDEEKVALTLRTALLPVPGATKLRIKGSIALIIATAEKLEEKEVKLQDGTSESLGPIEVRGRGHQNESTYVDLCFTSNMLKSIQFLDSNGIPVSSERVGHCYCGTHEVVRTESFKLKGKVEQVKVKVVYVSTTQTVNVPLNLIAGLALSPIEPGPRIDENK